MRIIKKLTKYLLITLLILIFASPLWIKIIPTKHISFLTGKLPVVDSVVCNFSTKVSGESMGSLIPSGSSIVINRCFEDEDLKEGTVVLFNDNANLRFGVVRHVLPLDPVVYKVSDEKAPELLLDVIKEEITGITKSIDMSKSKYQAKRKTESFILNANEFLTDLYLAKIPHGMGIEVSTVEKTTSFSRQEDKFCSVIVPKKNLTAVATEITDIKTQKIISQGNNIVFNVSSKPNINCKDFGSSQGMLNLDPGSYRYKFLINHQVLANIQFEVR
ncbi:MAG: hypothetical protein M1514_01495 [Patescibacteria group bacterium]|nr:hypothetical protein [Patescibacteria group bacterium]